MKILYNASAYFDIEDVDLYIDDKDYNDIQIQQKIIDDLKERYDLEISYIIENT